MKAFLAAGFEVGAVTGLQVGEVTTDLPVTLFIPAPGDDMGVTAGHRAIQEFKPDVLYVTGDPGNASIFSILAEDADIPYVSYIPIEGEPLINTSWREILAKIDFFTCSQYGVDVVRKNLGKYVDFVYHGVDTEVFNPMSPEDRELYRERLGWKDKFVISCVAQNVRRKQLPRLIEAIAILKKQFKQKDIVLYLHTVPFQGHWLDGWNLHDVSVAYDVYNEVIFNPLMPNRFSSVPERGDIEVPGLRELIGSSDLFVLPSQIEGFGLPIVEAMACGVPTMVTKYGAGWEVSRLGGGVGLQPHDWEIHKSGTRYANLDPLEIAKEIRRLRGSPKTLAKMSATGLEATKAFDWSLYEQMVVERVSRAAQTKAAETKDESAQPARPADQAPESTAEEDDLRERPSEDSDKAA